jgi:L-asparaginase
LIVILGTGGTIAGTASNAADGVAYTAGQVGVAQLLGALPASGIEALEVEQLAQIDSKDLGPALWQTLAQRIEHHLARTELAGIVITHGTDTLEETAYLLQRVLAPAKPVVLTAAMRPSTSLQTDGPQNLLDALTLASYPNARGVLVAMAGRVHAGAEVRKQHPYRLDAFDAGDAGPVALIAEGSVELLRNWPSGAALGLPRLMRDAQDWPWVEIVASHAGADGRVVACLVAAGVRGIVVAATGNGTVHRELETALQAAQAAGVAVMRSTRCIAGGIVGQPAGALPSAGALTPAQARVELMLRLLA